MHNLPHHSLSRIFIILLLLHALRNANLFFKRLFERRNDPLRSDLRKERVAHGGSQDGQSFGNESHIKSAQFPTRNLDSDIQQIRHQTSENTPLLAQNIHHFSDADTRSTISLFKYEIYTVVMYAVPTMLSLLLQTSISVSSIFVVGRLGTRELGAVSLANMTAIISGYAIYQGFSISLDTLCPQAFGSGKYQLVGLYMQRMTVFLLMLTIPIAAVWFNAGRILTAIIPEKDAATAGLAGAYLRITLFGAPGFACFEAGKKFVQAQGLFFAPMYVLLICAPLNVVMSWMLVWVSAHIPGKLFVHS